MSLTNVQIMDEARRVLQSEIDSLVEVREAIRDNFAEAVRLLSSTNKIIVSGVGKSGIICKKIAATFSSLGLPAYFLHPVDALHGDIGIVEEDDVALLLSKSGSTEEITRLVPYLRSRRAKIIVIVADLNSYLARIADVVLNGWVESEACPLNIAPMASTLVALALGDALAACVIREKNITIEDFSRQHPLGQLGRNILLTVGDVMHKDAQLPVVLIDSTFKEAVIKISEKRLGCACVVDNKMQLMGMITDGDVRRTLQKHDDLSGLIVSSGMSVHPITITPDVTLGEALSLMSNRDSQISVLAVVDFSW